MSTIFNALFYNPLYNGLIFLLSLLPGADVGLAIILFTILVKLALFPLSKKAVRTQMALKSLEPELARIKTEYKDNQTKQAEATMRLYRDNNINPFSGFFVLFIQLPIIIALYFVFLRGGLPSIHTELLYPFVTAPGDVSMSFLGLVDVSTRNIVLAFLAAAAQFFQVRFAMPPVPPKKEGEAPSFKDDLARSMSMQMRYVMPVLTFIIGFRLPAAIPLYWAVSSLFTLGQELYLRRTFKKPGLAVAEGAK
jgi:YidC/Oxa1 family membrane protein insertase